MPLWSLYEPFYHINLKCALYHTRCVLGGASREHVLAAVWSLLPTKPSPRKRMQGGESLQAFTAAGRIVDEVPYLSLIWCQRAAPPIALARKQGALPSAGNFRGLPRHRPRVILSRLFVVSRLHRRGRRTHGMGSGGQRCRRARVQCDDGGGRVPADSCQTCRGICRSRGNQHSNWEGPAQTVRHQCLHLWARVSFGFICQNSRWRQLQCRRFQTRSIIS